jgi:hypothetical protein
LSPNFADRAPDAIDELAGRPSCFISRRMIAAFESLPSVPMKLTSALLLQIAQNRKVYRMSMVSTSTKRRAQD